MSKVIIYIKFEEEFEHIWEARKFFDIMVEKEKFHYIRLENEKGDCLKSWSKHE